MATNYPGAIDSFTNPTSGDTLDSPSHAAQHANINDAVVAVQTKLGVGSGTIGTWTAYTPTVTNWTGTFSVAEYSQLNDIVFIRFAFTSSANSTGVVSVSVPINSTATGGIVGSETMGSGYGESGGTGYDIQGYFATAGAMAFYIMPGGPSIGSSVIGSGNVLRFFGAYKA